MAYKSQGSQYSPPDPQNYAIRPLNKGMMRHFTSTVIPEEACITAENFLVEERGPRRRDGSVLYAGGAEVPYRIADSLTFWTTEGTQISFLTTDGPLYRVGLFTGISEVPWQLEGNVASASPGFILNDLNATFITDGVQPRDILLIGSEEIRIASVGGETVLNLQDPLTEEYTDENYVVKFTLRNDRNYRTDWTIINNELIFADFKHNLQVYDLVEDTLKDYVGPGEKPLDIADNEIDFTASSITNFADRVWVGHIIERVGGLTQEYRQRIRWSIPTNPRNFSRDVNFIDLPYTNGAIQRMERFGDGIAVYMTDAIFIGTRTNNPDLPLAFRQLDTGGIGLVGQKAMTPWLEGHFFVGQDDIYFLSNNGLERLGTPVIRDTIKKCDFPTYIYVQPDPINERIIFGFPEESDRIEKLWSFNYKVGAWSYDAVATDFIANPEVNFELTWADLTGTWEDLANAYPTWSSMSVEQRDRLLYFENARRLVRFEPGETTDLGEPIRCVFETKDYDLTTVDTNKTWLRLGIKIDYELELGAPINFRVQMSANRGRRWVEAGTLTIREDEDEGYCSFLMTSSHIRFRLTSNSPVRPYWITEMVIRMRGRGREITQETQSNVSDTQG